jgi:outer membrane lipoprotein-sorting protein
MTRIPDTELRAAHELFTAGHTEHRDRLMSALQHAKQTAPRQSWWQTVPMPMRLTAAGLLIAATAALIGLLQGDRAYGVEGLRERLLAIRSLHVKGFIYQQTKTDVGPATIAFPTEFYCGRPLLQYHRSYGFGFNDGERLTQVTKHISVSDGNQTMLLDQNNKTAIFSTTDTLRAELQVESSLQIRLFEPLRLADAGEFHRVGEDLINDQMCHVYEHFDSADEPMRFRTRIWLDPNNGMPVKVVTHAIERNGTEVIFSEWNEIGINVDPPAEMFLFQVPEGYQRIEPAHPKAGNSILIGGGGSISAGGKSASFSQGPMLNIDNRAVLIAWSLRSTGQNVKDGPQWFDIQPEFTLEDATRRPCDEITLRTDESGDQKVRWSLIVPRDGQPLGVASLGIVYRLDRSTGSFGGKPLEVNAKRLPKLVEEIQQRTLPEDTDKAELWTLEEIRTKLREPR